MTDEQGEIGRSRPCFSFFNQFILSAQGFEKLSFSDESLTVFRTQAWDTKNFFVSADYHSKCNTKKTATHKGTCYTGK